MKRSLLIVFLFLKILFAFAQTQTDSTNYIKFYFDNGILASEGFMDNGKPDGYWKTYYENGILKSEGNRKNFLLDSVWIFYNDKGDTVLIINYKNDLKNGIRRTINENETVEEFFVDDKKQGETRYYYPDGKLKKLVFYVNDKETGVSKEYAQDGTIIVLTEYRNGSIIRRENINRVDRNGKKQGVWKLFYTDETLKEEGFYVNGRKNGYFKQYDVNGVLKIVEKYVDDVIQEDVPELASYEIRTDYYDDGSVKVVGSYKNGVPEGIRREYDANGKITDSYIFEKGVIMGEGIVDEKGLKQGFWKEFFDNGKLRAEGNYKDNTKTGDWKFYTENEKLKQNGKFNKNGFQTGEWKWFHENGQLQKTENFVNGVLEGTTEEFDENGKLICSGQYIEGYEDGPWFFVTNNYRQEGTYSYGRRNGIWKHYYDSEQLKFEGNFIDDYADGKHFYYWENGRVAEERIYIMGKADGTWRKYDETGALFIYIDYKRGYEYRYDGVILKPIIEEP
jgi:uncharacterized protein